MLRIGVLPLLLAAASISAQEAASPGQEPVAWWPLDEVLDQGTPDRPGRKSDPVEGSHRLVAGVAGKAVVFANLSQPGSGNHWPVGQILSDGRTSLAPDRAAHFLGFPISQPPLNRGPDGRDYLCSLYGMTDRPFSELLELARSWSRAPELRVAQ